MTFLPLQYGEITRKDTKVKIQMVKGTVITRREEDKREAKSSPKKTLWQFQLRTNRALDNISKNDWYEIAAENATHLFPFEFKARLYYLFLLVLFLFYKIVDFMLDILK